MHYGIRYSGGMENDPAPIDHSAFYDLLRTCYEIDYLPETDPAWQTLRQQLFQEGVEIREAKGNTPFMVAAWSGKMDAAERLFRLGCDPAAYNDRGLCVAQSFVRDLSKRSENLGRVLDILQAYPHQWPRPDGVDMDGLLDSWLAPLMSMSRSRLGSPQQLGKLLDYVFSPMTHDEARRLTHRHSTGEDTVGASIEWKSRVADKAALALRAIAGRPLEDSLTSLPRM